MGKEFGSSTYSTGTYEAICDPHKRRMRVELTVT